MHLTAENCATVSAPQIKEAPVSIECKVKSITNFGTHDMFLAEITAVDVDDKFIDESGKLWLEKAGLIAYVHGFYYTLGRKIGKFGFSVEKNPKKSKAKEAKKIDFQPKNSEKTVKKIKKIHFRHIFPKPRKLRVWSQKRPGRN